MSNQDGKSIEPLHMGFLVESGRNICVNKSGRVIAVAKDDELARRIVACVNACEGLPIELIDKHGVTRSGIAKGIEELANQRYAAWEEASLIRDLIGANQEESTLDEVRRVVNAHDNLVSALRVAHRQRDELLTICRNVVERGICSSDVKAMKAAIACAFSACAATCEKCNSPDLCRKFGRACDPYPGEENETSAPAIFFYPAGSLGEAVDSEVGEA